MSYIDSVEHRAVVYSLGSASPAGRALRKRDFLEWIERHDREVRAAYAEALAQDARARGDIGHPEGISAERYLNGEATRAREGFDMHLRRYSKP